MKYIFGILAILTLVISLSNAQKIASSEGNSSKGDSTKNFSLKLLPYFNYGRTQGFMFGAIPMAMYKINKLDTISPESMSGLLGMYTTEKTWFAMFFQKLYLQEDNWRVTAAGGLASVNFQFYLDVVGGGFVDYTSNANFLYVEGQRRIVNNLYGGVHYLYVQSVTEFEGLPEATTDTNLNGIGLLTALDERDDVYYPTTGSISNIKWSSFPDYLGNENISNKLDLDHNQYISMRDNDVLALRAYGGFGLGDLAFEQQFVIGQTDIRGYTQGEHRGESMAAIQGEYRLNFEGKIGLVGFVGLATVWKSTTESDNGTLLPGGGVGFRYTVFPDNHMNIGMDAALGKNDWGIYFKIGEAF